MKVQELIGEVARRHNVLVDPSDPVFIAVTLNEILLAEHTERIEAALKQAEARIADLSARQLRSARWIAAALIADASALLGDQLRAAGPALGAELRAILGEATPPADSLARGRARLLPLPGVAVHGLLACACLLIGLAGGAWLANR